MSTRSIIIVTGADQYNGSTTHRLYKHSDGYPTGNLPILRDALKRHSAQVAESNARWKSTEARMSVDGLAGLIVGEGSCEYGMTARLEKTFHAEFNPKHLGNQWDLEWMYVVNLDTKSVSIYGGDFNNGPLGAFDRGVKDPLDYAKQLKPEYQTKEHAEIRNLVKDIESLGFKVNPAEKSKPAKKSRKRKLELVSA